ncbi:EamA domain-containing membrane protein RarD [Bosea sp. BK604]|nr:EamA domain-containing membrane protein RarD [Bosea sp. BK604]
MTTQPDQHARGALFVLAATVAWSASGIYSRLLTTDAWTAIAWRSLFAALFLIVPMLMFGAARTTREWRAAFAPAGLAMIACQTISQAAFLGAYFTTSVANVAVIYATAPFIAAVLGRLLLKEPIVPRTMLTGLVCLIGVAIIISASIGGGTVLGDLLALLMTATFAGVIVLPRLDPKLPTMPSIMISALLTFVLFVPFSSPGSLDAHNWIVLAAFGGTNFSVALVLFIIGARHLPPAEAALIGTVEIVMTPLWVWLLFSEQPPLATMVGGAIIFGAVVWHTATELRRARRNPA